MSLEKNTQRQAWEHFRFAIVGPLLAAPPESGQLQTQLRQLAEKHWQHPLHNHRTITLSVSTLERWYYAAKRSQDPVSTLKRQRRKDAGQTRKISKALAQVIETQYHLYPHWSIQLHYDNLKAQSNNSKFHLPSYATVSRFMKHQGWHKRIKPRRQTPGAIQAQARLEQREVRSFEVTHVGGLWHLDFHHGSFKILTHKGQWVTPKLLGIIDDRSRLICHAQWYLEETAEVLVHGFCQALQKRGLPRSLMTDNGAAMIAEEFTQGLHRLGILWEPTLPYSPYQNAKQETFWSTLEGRLMAMLCELQPLSLKELNEWTQIWIEQDYHRNHHRELGMPPLTCYLNTDDVTRPCPDDVKLKRAFCRSVIRKQRRSDGTIALSGKRYEIPNVYRHIQKLTINYASWNLSTVDLMDPNTDQVITSLLPLDKTKNADAQRKKLVKDIASQELPIESKTQNLPPLLEKLKMLYESSGQRAAYLPKDELK